MEAIGHAVVGDPVYASGRQEQETNRPMLHATELAFAHPSSGERVHFEAPLPADFAAILAGFEAVQNS
jgi:23S rRNA-/tRNA-specific pseudouridylate synthase